MKRMLIAAATLVAALLWLPDAAEGQKRDKVQVTRATPQDYAQLRNSREITGKIVFVDASSNLLSLRLESKQKTPVKGQPKFGWMITTVGKDYEFQVEAAAPIRKMFVGVEFDDKGFVKDKDEAAALLRSKGYIPVKYSDIQSGMVAKLALAPPKAGAKEEGKPTVRSISLIAQGDGALQNGDTPAKKKAKK